MQGGEKRVCWQNSSEMINAEGGQVSSLLIITRMPLLGTLEELEAEIELLKRKFRCVAKTVKIY